MGSGVGAVYESWRGYLVSGRALRVLFLTPYFRPYLGGIERAIEQLTFQFLSSDQVVYVGVLTTKYSFPRIPPPVHPPLFRAAGLVFPLADAPVLGGVQPRRGPLRGRWLVLGALLDLVVVPQTGRVRFHAVISYTASQPVVASPHQCFYL